MNKRYGFAALVAAVGVSIALGMILGNRFDAPPSAVGASPAALQVSRPDPGPPAAVAVDFSEIVEQAIPAVVSVSNTSIRRASGARPSPDDFFRFFFGPDSPRGRQNPPQEPERNVTSGSGFIITADGYILTNNHVVNGATKLEVTLDDGTKHPAEIVGSDPVIDLALLKIDAKGLPTVPLGDSDRLRVGEWVIAIGNPLALDHTVTVGVVSAKGRNVAIGETVGPLARFIQTDAAINFGNSGGPLLDARGRVIGINTAIMRNGGPFASPMVEGIGFALPINEAWNAAQQIRETGSVQRGYLGIEMSLSGIDERAKDYYGLPDTYGVLIERVTPGGPAEKAGLRAGDIIRSLDGESVKDNEDLLVRVATKRPGEKVRVELLREGKTVKSEVVLAVRPSDLSSIRRAPGDGPAPQEEPSPAVLGFRIGPIDERMRGHAGIDPEVEGVMVTEVLSDSDAADQGMTPGIVILSVNDRRVKSPADWRAAVRDIRPGAVAKLSIAGPQGGSRTVFVRAPETSAD